LVPHLCGLFLRYWRVGLFRLREGMTPSSNDTTGGVVYPRGKVSCSVLTTERTFHALSDAA
ncbi:hypothetical protein PHYSODRAFT_536542, partial [Phytophthora sojae]